MILYINSAYPATDASCAKVFDALKRSVGLRIDDILAAPKGKLTEIMKLGGIFPEQRAVRLKEIAALVKHTFAGDLRTVLKRPAAASEESAEAVPHHRRPSADKILLFTKTAPVAAIPSNCVHVLPRLGFGEEKKNYAATYRSAQEATRAQLPERAGALLRAYLLLKQHGQELCKRSRPRCEQCPVSSDCLYYKRIYYGRSAHI